MIREENENEMNYVSKNVKPSQSNRGYSETLRYLKKYRMQEAKLLTDATITEIARLARSMHELI